MGENNQRKDIKVSLVLRILAKRKSNRELIAKITNSIQICAPGN